MRPSIQDALTNMLTIQCGVQLNERVYGNIAVSHNRAPIKNISHHVKISFEFLGICLAWLIEETNTLLVKN